MFGNSKRSPEDFNDEIQSHIQIEAERLVEEGMEPDEALGAARRAFGNVTQTRERFYESSRWILAEELALDARFAIRLLWKERWFSIAAITALSLGLGVFAMAVTIIDGFYFRGLPVPEPERVLLLSVTDASGREAGVTYSDYQDWRESNRSFQELAAFVQEEMEIGALGETSDRREGAYVSATAFRVLGEQPVLGRGFSDVDDQPGAPPVVLLGHRLWSTRFAADPSIVGRTVAATRRPATVIGVMPEGFEFPSRESLWQPLAQMPGIETQSRDARTLRVFGRLSDGITLRQANDELASIAAALAADFPETNTEIRPRAVPFVEGQVGRFADDEPPQLFAVIAILVLVLACANVSNLLLARSTQRAREVAIRASIGATRWRTVRQFMVENVLLALPAGALGLALSRLGVRLVSDAFGRNVPYWMEFSIDGRVVLSVFGACLVTAVVFGLAPALSVSRTGSADVMKEAGRVGVAPRVQRWTDALLVGEVALTLILLSGAGLMVRSFLALYQTDRVVDTTGQLTAQLSWPSDKRPSAEDRATFYQRLDQRLGDIPGAQVASLASRRPFLGVPARPFALEGNLVADPEQLPSVTTVAIGPRYFETLGVPLQLGRDFTARDGLPGAEVAIVNQLFAETYYPGEDALGRQVRLFESGTEAGALPSQLTIVGVSPTIRQRIASGARPVVYVPLASYSGPEVAVMGRLLDPSTTEPLLREEIAALDPEVTMFNVRPLEDLLADSRLQPRLMGMLSPIFAGIALILSMIGLYSVTAYSVLQRIREIGVRIALGAGRRQVVWLFARKRLWPLAGGFAIGLVGAFGLTRVLRRFLVLTSPTDPLSILMMAVTGLLVFVVLAASVLPAWRASRLEPLAVLRDE